MSDAAQIIEADLTWTGSAFEEGVRVAVDAAGMIVRAGRLDEQPTVRLRHRALLPGMVNAHSHAFQRGLRGRGESFPQGAGSFWTWREEMYALVERMDEQTIYELSLLAFEEMLDAGITCVGEFHYLHHDASGRGFAFDRVVLRAARDAGIRIALLSTFYEHGGINLPLKGGQLRFATPSVEEYLAQLDALRAIIDPATQSLGIVAHSIRAVSIEHVQILYDEALRRGLPFHMHVEEQIAEITATVEHYHKGPLALLNDRLSISPHMTSVHCTHSAGADLDTYLEAGGNICLCPLTEGNLGDGIPNIPRMLRSGNRICLGTDSNARLSMLEDMRWLEYVQRLAGQKRGVCVDEAGEVAPVLWRMATVIGAHALGVPCGAIAPRRCADFIAIDLAARELAGADASSLLAALILGGDNRVMREVCVAGRWVRGEA